MSRLFTYGGVSTLLAVQAIASAWTARANFYSTCIHLTRSSASLLVLLNFTVFVAIMMGRGIQKTFFGQLRAIEVEHLYERSWFAVTETCLAMTLFRDQFDAMYLVLFGFLLVVKIFHWLVADRVDFMEQAPTPPTRVFHIRMITIMTMLVAVDMAVLVSCVDYTTRKGPSMMLIFGFENLIMMSSIILAIFKYIFHTMDLMSEHPWERKSMYIFYAELVIDLFKLCTYLAFFGIIMHYYGFPLHIVRDLYLIVRSFVQRCKDLVQYHRATRNMNERYPNATEEELAATDRVCIICREELVAAVVPVVAQGPAAVGGNVAKKLGCGHFFHLNCLRSWLERQQSCPTCRRSVLTTNPPVAATAGPAGPAPAAAAAAAPGAQPPPVANTVTHLPAQPAAEPAVNSTLAALQALLTQHHQQLMQQHGQHQQLHQQQHQQHVNSLMAQRAMAASVQPGEDNPLMQPAPAATIDRSLEAGIGSSSSAAPISVSGEAAASTAALPAQSVYGTPHVQHVTAPHVLYPFTLTPLTSNNVDPNADPLEALTDEQLRVLEGRTRSRILSRLKEVQKIQDHLALHVVSLGKCDR